jgi:GT2 family glycosyltransferase
MSFIPALSVLTSVYKGGSFLEPFFQNLRIQTLFPELEVVLVLNEPSQLEEGIVKDFSAKVSQQIQVVRVGKVENLGASWNRAWDAARAPYLAIWNIDDRRLPDSLGRQLTSLEQNPDWVLSYGDYLAVSPYGKEKGRRRFTPIYNTFHFARAFAQGGAFWVFRRDVSEQVGTFDEQFEVGPDMDLSLRIAARGLQMGRCEGLLGYFTNNAQGLSTRDGAKRSAIERTAIQLRYGIFDKVQASFRKEAQEICADQIKNLGNWHNLNEYLPNYENYLSLRRPLYILGWLRNLLRNALGKIGLLAPLYRLQEKFWRREI